MAKQPETLPEQTPKKRRLKLRDLPPQKRTKGGASKNFSQRSKSPIPKSLEDFLKRDSLRID